VSDELDGLRAVSLGLPAPEDVRVVFDDGTVLPVEVRYRGVDENGMHLWIATVTLRSMPVGVRIAHLPAHTAVAIEAARD